MALRKAQKEMAVTLFVKAFSAAKDESDRKELYIQFSDAYEGDIKDWQHIVEAEISDGVKEEFVKLANRTEKSDIKEYVTVEPLKIEDLEQISYLTSKELDMMPWVAFEMEEDSLVDFINSGYSYVAKREDVILGFILAYKCPNYGGHYSLYIDTLVVDSVYKGMELVKCCYKRLEKICCIKEYMVQS